MNASVASIPLKDVVLIGGGHSHVHVIKMFGMQPMGGVRVTVITKDIESPYSGMVPGYVAGYYTREECHIDVGKLCSFAKVRLIHAEVGSINIAEKLIFCTDGRPSISYDILSINIGIVPRPLSDSVAAAAGVDLLKLVTPVKPIDKFAERWERILSRILTASLDATTEFKVVIVGGGAGGVELAFAVHHRLTSQLSYHSAASMNKPAVKVALMNRGPTIMPSHSSDARRIIQKLLDKKGINVYNEAEIVGVERDTSGTSNLLVAKDGRRFNFHEAFWCTQAVAQSWTKTTGLACNEDGFIRVNNTLESINVKNVFSCGDVCHLEGNVRPKAGVFAVRAGPPLLNNIRLAVKGLPLEPWQPQDTFLGIIGTGDGYAVATKGGMGLEGAFLWKLKDRIDRVWMSGYQQLPSMEEMQLHGKNSTDTVGTNSDVNDLANDMGAETIELLSKAQMRCGGCGSKVGSQILQRALQRVKNQLIHNRQEEVVAGVTGEVSGGDDAALIVPPAAPAYLVQTIDYFRSFISDPYMTGAIAANHALSDVYAMNGEPLSAMALIVLPYAPESKVEEMLAHILAGALKVFKEANCALVGGHTSEGAEAAVGFSITGTVHPNNVLPKGPLKAAAISGDKIDLVLTKPIGTGTILAADMRAQASGGWVVNAISNMLQTNAPAVRILHEHGCTACTDVTGFGLIGHLLEMMQYDESRCRVLLKLKDIPLLEGAADCVTKGILSSLHPQNIRCSRAVINPECGVGKAAYPLLFDPQTSGGLIAAVPQSSTETVLNALHKTGFHRAAVIGRVLRDEEWKEMNLREDHDLSAQILLH